MKNNEDGINKVNNACRMILSLTDADFEDARKMAIEQGNYTHPLKNDKAQKYQELSEHNLRVVDVLQCARDIINCKVDN